MANQSKLVFCINLKMLFKAMTKQSIRKSTKKEILTKRKIEEEKMLKMITELSKVVKRGNGLPCNRNPTAAPAINPNPQSKKQSKVKVLL